MARLVGGGPGLAPMTGSSGGYSILRESGRGQRTNIMPAFRGLANAYHRKTLHLLGRKRRDRNAGWRFVNRWDSAPRRECRRSSSRLGFAW